MFIFLEKKIEKEKRLKKKKNEKGIMKK